MLKTEPHVFSYISVSSIKSQALRGKSNVLIFSIRYLVVKCWAIWRLIKLLIIIVVLAELKHSQS